jgi:hypothetical protein
MYENASNATILMLLHTAVYPFLAALIVSVVAGRWLHASPYLGYLGYLGGFIVGLSLIHSGLSFPPSQAIDYYNITALAGIASVLCLTMMKQSTLRNIINSVLFALSFYLLLNPVLQHSGLIASLSWAVGSAIVVLLYQVLSEKIQGSIQQQVRSKHNLNLPPLLLLIGLIIVAGSAAPVISIGGSLLIGQLLGAFGAAVFGYIIISFLTRTLQNHTSIPALLILGGLITQSHVLADIPLGVMLMLAASSFVTPISILLSPKMNSKQSIVIIAIQIIISGLISGLSLWLVWPASSLY